MDFIISLISKFLPVILVWVTSDDTTVGSNPPSSCFNGTEDLGRYFSSSLATTDVGVWRPPLVVPGSLDLTNVDPDLADALRAKYPEAIKIPTVDKPVFLASTEELADQYNTHITRFLGSELLNNKIKTLKLEALDRMDSASEAFSYQLERSRAATLAACAKSEDVQVALNSAIKAANATLPVEAHASFDSENFINDLSSGTNNSRERGTLLADTMLRDSYETVVEGNYPVTAEIPEMVIVAETSVSKSILLETTYATFCETDPAPVDVKF